MERREFIKYLAAVATMTLAGCGRRAEQKVVESIPAGSASNGVAFVSPTTEQPLVLPAPTAKGISAVSRKQWSATAPQVAKMVNMGACRRITVHHEGNAKPNYDSNPAAVAASLRNIQQAHCNTMSAGDIGYHFIVDRQGLIWQGRDLHYQGAHVKSNNSNNIGIMLLGNFEIQQPTGAQVKMLGQLCRALMQGYHIPSTQLFAHRELRNTACPGKNLVPYVASIRSQVRVA